MYTMTYHGQDFLVVVDYYAKFAPFPDKTANTIITNTKSICARHEIPEEIVRDNVPFGSREFKEFAREWGIKTTTSSQRYAQSNGRAESFVQTLKGLFKKADEDGRDPYLALLEYRNMPVSGLKYTPSQMLMSRLLRSKLPAKQTLLQSVQMGKVWEPAVVRGSHIQPRSYLVQSQHGQLRRNRRHLSKTNELPPLFVPPVGAAPAGQLLIATSIGASQ